MIYNSKVLAVIVTYNRRALLERCLDMLNSQNRKVEAILVINNSSTDDTVEMLKNRAVDYITQENVGSAGGWRRGIQHALENDFDAVWLMDDDGYPDVNALAVLQEKLVENVSCASSVVLKENSPAEFVFPFPVLDVDGLPVIFKHPRKLHTLAELSKVAIDGVYPFAHLFNGALISVAAIRKVGNVNQDFFIFGDEVDYFFRLRSIGKVISVLDAHHLHPDVSQRPYTPTKVYYYLKNTLILNGKYFNAVFIRNMMAIVVVLVRTAKRNGLWMAFSLLAGSNAPAFYSAIIRGLKGKIGKDFNG
jgi:rhamnopyranosyl-N-acetylglucosaminyl-diphospho-decaprenol beta-1,3/1,4-galactofuranosyltransferase